MTAALLGILVFLQSETPGRGEELSDSGGVLLVVGIAVLAALVALAALLFAVRLLRARRGGHDRSGRTVRRPTASEQGRPWSSDR